MKNNIQITNCQFENILTNGLTKYIVNVTINHSIIIKNFKIMEKNDNIIIAFPDITLEKELKSYFQKEILKSLKIFKKDMNTKLKLKTWIA